MSLDVTLTQMMPTEVYSRNITHNLTRMADEAGIYKHLWRPEELCITQARGLISALTAAWHDLESRPEYYKQFNPSNGWGSYETLLKFVREYRHACIENPLAVVRVSR